MLALRRLWPDAVVSTRPSGLVCEVDLQPSAVSPVYRVRINHQAGSSPHVRVLSPALDPGEREVLPHVYRNGDLCLYSTGDWTNGMYLAETIVPWTAEWLYFYELWRATGEWHGGGKPLRGAALIGPKSDDAH